MKNPLLIYSGKETAIICVSELQSIKCHDDLICWRFLDGETGFLRFFDTAVAKAEWSKAYEAVTAIKKGSKEKLSNT